MLVFTGIVIDHRRAQRRLELDVQIQANRLRVLKATMRTVQDIVNNFLNNMQLIELEAGDALSQQTVTLLETITHETSGKLKALGNLQSTPEVEMASGLGIDYSKG